VPEAIEKLRDAGFLLICATNQPDVARGRQKREIVEAINEMLLKVLPLDEILVCYHDDSDNCSCRKPLPGMLIKAAKEYDIDLVESFMVGDRWRDIEAGQKAGCRNIFIEYDYEKEKPKVAPDKIVRSLLEATKWILEQTKA
jgi:D-glycero-D-manno-heptose 1,7-bisphosphate phosphatase